MDGEVIGTLQIALNAAGGKLAETRRFDDATESAVKAFQSRSGLPSTGVVDDATWAKLIR